MTTPQQLHVAEGYLGYFNADLLTATRILAAGMIMTSTRQVEEALHCNSMHKLSHEWWNLTAASSCDTIPKLTYEGCKGMQPPRGNTSQWPSSCFNFKLASSSILCDRVVHVDSSRTEDLRCGLLLCLGLQVHERLAKELCWASLA